MKFSSLLCLGCTITTIYIAMPATAAPTEQKTSTQALQQASAEPAAAEPIKQQILVKEIVIQPENVFVPETALQVADKNFLFDWNDYTSFSTAKPKVSETEALLKNTPDYTKVGDIDKQPLGDLFYKLGTYYTHVTRQPDMAIPKLELAVVFFPNKDDKAWGYNQLAYAYEQKYTISKKNVDAEKALAYTNKVINEMYQNQDTKEVAFAYCVQGLVQNNLHNDAEATASFKKALVIYETIPDGIDDQYMRAKNKLAMLMLNQPGQEKQALTQLEEIKKYWMEKGNLYQEPYAAKNFISLGKAYLKINNPAAACVELNRAITIYKSMYGLNSPFLTQPYQLLMDTYVKLGDQRQAQAYKNKISSLNKSQS